MVALIESRMKLTSVCNVFVALSVLLNIHAVTADPVQCFNGTWNSDLDTPELERCIIPDGNNEDTGNYCLIYKFNRTNEDNSMTTVTEFRCDSDKEACGTYGSGLHESATYSGYTGLSLSCCDEDMCNIPYEMIDFGYPTAIESCYVGTTSGFGHKYADESECDGVISHCSSLHHIGNETTEYFCDTTRLCELHGMFFENKCKKISLTEDEDAELCCCADEKCNVPKGLASNHQTPIYKISFLAFVVMGLISVAVILVLAAHAAKRRRQQEERESKYRHIGKMYSSYVSEEPDELVT
ncbi:PREDICTED: uncharacterized protein LOC106807601 [Priapulus caudatus]|uniref:Uncharacterized protein LOC106807601 n=1 Tax=Priapulus caudatus TaxID=37621 RepID=A0ABM1DZW1_PRICU|nr:PREDICTED: uncharacterized protein LOC106807601 [Priapulus caudatus]